MQVKYMLIFLISLLLSSCNLNINKFWKEYYLDGLSSKLFVYDVMEEYMEFTYEEETDSYDLFIGIKDDDGIHGLKRVKAIEIEKNEVGYLNSLIVSTGLKKIKGTIINQMFKNIYLPSSIEEMDKFYTWNPYFAICGSYLFDLKIYYDGSLEQFRNIKFNNVLWFKDYIFNTHEHKVKIYCNNGDVEYDFAWPWFEIFWTEE